MDTNQRHIHKFSHIDVPSTCKENGYTLHKCECGYEHKDNFKPLGSHNFLPTESKPATCTTAGLITARCTFCGETKTSPLAPLGHKINEWNTVSFATCTEDGKKIRFCGRCGEAEEEIIPALGHNITAFKKSKTEKGMKECFCKNCGQTITRPTTSKKFFSFLKRRRKVLICTTAALLVVACMLTSVFHFFIPNFHYSKAQEYLKEDNFAKAYYHLRECYGFGDSAELLADFDITYEKKEVFYYDEDGKMTSHTEYNEYGDQVLYISYDEDEKIKYWWETTYDENGNETYYAEYDKDNYLTKSDTYEYDERGYLVIHKHYDAETEQITKERTDNIYDENGNRIKSTTKDDLGRTTETFEFDGNNTITTEYFYHEDDSLNYQSKTVCNKNDQIISEAKTYEDLSQNSRKEYSYDEKGRQISCITYDASGVVSKETSKYDKDGNLTVTITYDAEGKVIEKITYEYDDHGNLTIYTYYSESGDVKTTQTTKNTYNLRGKLIHEITHNQDGKLVSEFKYDKNGDCIYYHDNIVYDAEDGDIAGENEGTLRYNKYGDLVFSKGSSEYDSYYRYEYTYEYKYDKNGVVTEKVITSKDDSKNVTIYTNPKVVYLPRDKDKLS